jgi:hypothetical protein
LREPDSQLLELTDRGVAIEPRSFLLALEPCSLSVCTCGQVLELALDGFFGIPAAFELLTAQLEVPIRLLELDPSLLEIFDMVIQVAPVLLDLLLPALDLLLLVFAALFQRFACDPQIVEISARPIDLVAKFVECALESADLKCRIPPQLFALLLELTFLARELFSRRGELLLRLFAHGLGCFLGGLGECPTMLVGDRAENVRCRCAQFGFELAGEADAQTIERRTNVVV